MTRNAGQPFEISYPSGGSITPSYRCYSCGTSFDRLSYRKEPDRVFSVCPSCGSEEYTQHPYAGRFVGTYLDALYLYKENPMKDSDAALIRQYSCDNNTRNFSCSILIKKPGIYYLEYLYTTFYFVGDSEDRTYETLNILGQVAFNSNGGRLPKSKSSVWIKQKGKVGTLPKPKRNGYKFLGWYTAKNGGVKINSNTRVTFRKVKVTYYAHWEKIK